MSQYHEHINPNSTALTGDSVGAGTPPGTFHGLPNFFQIKLRHTQEGGSWGYRGLGIEFAQVVCRLVPYDFDGAQTEWADLVVEELSPLLKLHAEDSSSDRESSRAQVLSWIRSRFPALAARVPASRLNNFISGMTLVYLDGEML